MAFQATAELSGSTRGTRFGIGACAADCKAVAIKREGWSPHERAREARARADEAFERLREKRTAGRLNGVERDSTIMCCIGG